MGHFYSGGFHRSFETGQLYGIVPFGETGFDEKAIFYWRRHEGQTNKITDRRGHIGIKEFYSMLDDFKIKEMWSVFGKDVADEVISKTSQEMCQIAAGHTVKLLFDLNLRGFLRVFSDSAHRRYYWKALPNQFWENKKYLHIQR